MAKWLNIGIGANNEQLKKDMQSAAGVVEAGSNKMADAAVAGGAKMEQAQAKTAETLRTLQQQFRQADRDAQMLAQTQGMNSAAFIEAARTAGDYRDQLMDVREVSAAFASGTPVLQSTIGIVKGLAGGFATAQSAAALFGAESQDLQETLLRVQAAMALMQGLQQLEALSSAWVAFSAVMKTQVLPAILTVNGALMAGAIGVAVAAFVALNMAVDNYNSALEREIALEKTSIENKKEMATAVGKAMDEILRARDLEIRAMQDGIEKAKAELENKKAVEKAKEKAIYESSQKTVFDKHHYEQNIKNIETFYYNERLKLLKDFEDKKKKAMEPHKKTAPINLIESQAVHSTKLNPANYKPAQIAQENFQNQSYNSAVAYANSMMQLNANINQTVEQGMEQAVGGMAAALGTALADGTNVVDAMGAALLGAVGNMAVQLGQLAIATGITAAKIKLAFASPYTAIAAGIALVALGSAVGAAARSITSGSSGGGSQISPGGAGMGNESFRPTFNPAQYAPVSAMIEVGGVLKGNDIILSVKNSDRNRRRVV